MASRSNKRALTPDVVKALLSQHFAQKTTKLSKPGADAAAQFLELFVQEAFTRAAKLARAEAAAAGSEHNGSALGHSNYADHDDDGTASVGASAGFYGDDDDAGALLVGGGTQPGAAGPVTVTPDHVRKVLPALLLDF